MSMPTPADSTRTLDLDAIRARADAATQGPWWAWNRGVGWVIALGEPDDTDEYGRPRERLPEGFRTDIERREDVEFIAAARTDVPALLDEVQRLRSLYMTVPSVSLDGNNTAHLEWVNAGRTLHLTFYDDGTHEVYFDDGQGEDWEVQGQSPHVVEAFRKLLAGGS